MKWFKHISSARNDEKISSLIDMAGIEGYGFYFLLVEIISSKIGATDTDCSCTYSLRQWSRLTYCHHNKVSKLLGTCQVTGVVTIEYLVEYGESKIKVTIPNILKYRDNHTKNLQATYKQEVDKEIDIEVDIDKEKDKEIPSGISPQKVDPEKKENEEIPGQPCETESNPKKKRTEPIPYQAIVDLYQEKLPMLNGVYKLTDTRKNAIRILWQTTELNTLETWGNYFAHVKKSKFLTGRGKPDRATGRTWKADLDFLINSTNFVKISEDKYHG